MAQNPDRAPDIKSNYECIRERSHSEHGLNYSNSFVAITVSKNTAHVLDEWNRRRCLSRATEGLQRMVPQICLAIERGRSPSKATIIERVIGYINTLHRELDRLLKEETTRRKEFEPLPEASLENASSLSLRCR